MRSLPLPEGGELPVLGQGTWGMGERDARRAAEVDALRHGLDSGIRLIDTAEMYGGGGAEQVVGTALRGRRDEAFVVSKVFPHNADRGGTVAACERSLRRLGTDRLDLYLLHWRGATPLEETMAAFESLQRSGKIRYFGVSNFDPADMSELFVTEAGRRVSTDQVLYNLTRRGPEFDLLPWCRQRNLPVMAYSPIEQGRLLDDPVLGELAAERGVTPAQLALAWVLRQDGMCAIPKAATVEHVDHNRAAVELSLSDEELARLDERFPPPGGPTPLEIL
ncbi:Aldo/keto reductase [Actinopolyspora lacussalsi subsp. righensis]|uniref:Aldo/keto reductase n=1 Tax=Actinopolyspora righensis TaxID=995060 RepID=A0A1I7C4Y4_9ACTN|nr:aldo/keto reductase [Actinopolyspora righensis]SFT94491.1 Aldo/keto reductase [Actinopolyspora righensis]